MKFRCECGHVIRDQTDDLPYKCDLLPDAGYWDNIHQPIVKFAADLAAAIADDDRDGWITRTFGSDYPRNLDNASMLSDLLAATMTRAVTAHQCTECGCLYISRSANDGFHCFRPVDDDWRGAISWRK